MVPGAAGVVKLAGPARALARDSFARHPSSVDADPLDGLSGAERAWVLDNERLWQRAHAIVAAQPHLDVSLVYHTLVNLRRTPSERLARGLRPLGTARTPEAE